MVTCDLLLVLASIIYSMPLIAASLACLEGDVACITPTSFKSSPKFYLQKRSPLPIDTNAMIAKIDVKIDHHNKLKQLAQDRDSYRFHKEHEAKWGARGLAVIQADRVRAINNVHHYTTKEASATGKEDKEKAAVNKDFWLCIANGEGAPSTPSDQNTAGSINTDVEEEIKHRGGFEQLHRVNHQSRSSIDQRSHEIPLLP